MARRSSVRSWGCAWPSDRKSTRLNSSHGYISYAVVCWKKQTVVIPSQFDWVIYQAAYLQPPIFEIARGPSFLVVAARLLAAVADERVDIGADGCANGSG